MTLDSTLKKNKKKQKPPKKSKRSSASPGRCRRCCGRFTTFLFSHVGLCALVIGYSIMGAFAFRALEAPYEEQKASQVGHLRQETVRRLWEITDKLNVLYKDNWTELVEAEVRRFQKELIVAVKEGYDGKEGSGQQWSFSGAFLYSLTVITTIDLASISFLSLEYSSSCTFIQSQWSYEAISRVLFSFPADALFLLWKTLRASACSLNTISYVGCKGFSDG
ncbi:hypothetical protein TNCT_261621 [Trichonephila clavata]|uniref:TWiK family of potassium channels protein 7 n=1 Tax=Trichonephila clavata TaxID=2740835 RepID=A0A8X6G5N2_TRICU|nr:hypothetical protein TNCT_261621 [Trichonephila clavata]